MRHTAYAALLLAAAAAALVACQKRQVSYDVQLSRFEEGWDIWDYIRDEDGRIVRVRQNNGEKYWDFTWHSDRIDISGSGNMTLELGADGLVTGMTDQWDNVWAYDYDYNGFMTQARKNGRVVSNIKTGGKLVKSWSKILTDLSGNDSTEVRCLVTYTDTVNKSGVHLAFSGRSGVPRWMQETGLFGRASKNLPACCRWDDCSGGFDYQYTLDEDGYVTRVTSAPAGSGYLESARFSWEPLSKASD